MTVATLADNLVEGDESASIQLTDGGSTYSAHGSSAIAALAIDDDPPILSVEQIFDADESGTEGLFQVLRSGGNIGAALTITFSLSGSATNGSDFTNVSGTLSFVPGIEFAAIWIIPETDSVQEGQESVIITLSAGGSSYELGDSTSATMVLVDEDYASSDDGPESDLALTFTLGGEVGTLYSDYQVDDLDPTLGFQSLSMINFNLEFLGEAFTDATADFTAAPAATFAYGIFTGVTFCIDSSAVSGYAYSTLSMSGLEFSGVTHSNQTVESTAAPIRTAIVLDFADVTRGQAYEVEIVVFHDNDDITTTKKVTIGAVATTEDIRDLFQTALDTTKGLTVRSKGATKLELSGMNDVLDWLRYDTYKKNANGRVVQDKTLVGPVVVGAVGGVILKINP